MNDGPIADYDAGRPEPDVLRAVISYCRTSESFANESFGEHAIGLARAYRDVADRLEQRLESLRVIPSEKSES